jgi:hypothetical protein
MSTSRPPLTGNRPLHAKTPGRSLQKARGILQENAPPGSHAARVVHKVRLLTPLRVKPRKLTFSPASSEIRPLFSNLQCRVSQDRTPGCASRLRDIRHFRARWVSMGQVLYSRVRSPMGNQWDVTEHDIAMPTWLLL